MPLLSTTDKQRAKTPTVAGAALDAGVGGGATAHKVFGALHDQPAVAEVAAMQPRGSGGSQRRV